MKKPSRVAALNLGMQTATMAVFESASDGGITLAGFAQAALVPDPAADASRPGQLKVALAEMAAKQWTAQFNPRTPSVEDFVELYRAAL